MDIHIHIYIYVLFFLFHLGPPGVKDRRISLGIGVWINIFFHSPELTGVKDRRIGSGIGVWIYLFHLGSPGLFCQHLNCNFNAFCQISEITFVKHDVFLRCFL